MAKETFIRFDWATKRLLRQKSNFVILEGFLSTLLDEWISFLKTSEIPVGAKAQGLSEARKRLQRDAMSKKEQQEYEAHIESLCYQRSVIHTGWVEGREKGLEEGMEKGMEKGRAEGEAERIQLKAELAEKKKKETEQAARIAELERILSKKS